MSPEVLWCNLDPAWSFADLVQCHCLDLLPGEHTWVWDASGVVKVSASHWPDWPRPIAPERLPDTLDDLPTPPALGPPLLVLLHLPAQPPSASLVALLSECAQRLARRHAELVLTLPPDTDLVGSLPWWPDALMVVRLTDGDALRRLHGERLLIEWLQDPELGAELRGLLSREVLDLTLSPHRDQVGWDRVAGDWAGSIPGVLQEVELLERGVGAGTGADSEPSQGMKRVFGELEVVIEGPGATPPPITPAALAGLRLRVPLFRRAELSRRLGERRTDFLAHLNDHLEKRYSELAAAHQGLAEHQRRREAELVERLSSLVPASIGFGSPGQRWLDAQEARLRSLEQEATQRAEHLMGELERDLRPAEPERLGDYLRHRFAEDESFDAAVTAAQQEASRLLPLTPLAAALGIATLVASVPVLAARLPVWWGQGLTAYLGDANLWAGDLLWLVLPGALLVLAALALGRQRRRGLAVAWVAVEQGADTLWQRHGRVLEATFQYAELVFALRQLGLIRDRLKRLREELRAGRQGLNTLKAGLDQQAHHYRSLAPVFPDAGISPPIGPLLAPALAAGGGPRQWTEAMMRALPRPTTEPIEVHHHALVRSAQLPSAYLRGYASAQLLPSGQTGRP